MVAVRMNRDSISDENEVDDTLGVNPHLQM